MALALLAYLPALGAGFLWDDDALTASPLVASWDGFWKIWTPPSLAPREVHYWPLVYATFWLEHKIWGLHPCGYHLVNILLHGLCAVLLWRVLRELKVPGAWLAGALFAVHPVHAESVAWIIERKDVLSGALALGAALAFLKCGITQQSTDNKQQTTGSSQLTTHDSQPNIAFYLLSFALFTGALLSKSIVVGLPLALAAVTWWRRGGLTRREVAALALMAAMAAALTIHDLKFMKAHAQQAYDSGLGWLERILLAARAVWFYLSKIFWPHPLASFYPKWDVNPAQALAWAPLVAGLGLLGGLWAVRGRIGRGPLAAALVFVVLLAPALGLVDYGFMDCSWVADRFQYLASAAPIALAAAGLARLTTHNPQLTTHNSQPAEYRLKAEPPNSQLTTHNSQLFNAILLTLLASICFYRASLYRDAVTVYSQAARAYPQCWAGHYLRAYGLSLRGESAEALQSLRAARRLRTDFLISNTMGQIQTDLGQYPDAEASFKEALQLKPDHAETHNSYAVLLVQLGRTDEAVARFRRALELEPENAKAMAGLGVALKLKNDFGQAEQYLAAAAQCEPDNTEFLKELGLVRAKLGRHAAAEQAFEAGLVLQPNHPEILAGMGRLAAIQNQPAKAAGYFERALALNPRSPQYLAELGQVYENMGRTQEAMVCFGRARALDAEAKRQGNTP